MITSDNIKIREIEIYHPETYRDNEYYIKYYENQGIPPEETRKLLEEKLAKDKRYTILEGSGENSLTMGIEAAKKVLKKSGLAGKDMDMVCFVSCTPEYMFPPTALKIHNAINGSSKALCFDLNANCIGMASAMEQVYCYMSVRTQVKRVLIIASEYFTGFADKRNALYYASFTDSACAMILEKTKEDSYFIDSEYYVISNVHERVAVPACGMSKVFTGEPENILCRMDSIDQDNQIIYKTVKTMLANHHLTPQDIDLFCVCQFSEQIVRDFQKDMGVEPEKVPYVGRKYGYTGASTPFLALYETIQSGKLHRGDYIYIWTTGFCIENVFLLLRY